MITWNIASFQSFYQAGSFCSEIWDARIDGNSGSTQNNYSANGAVSDPFTNRP